jgi:hypothetical protein
MMTENGAKAINHWTNGPDEAGVGQIAVGSMGSLIAVGIKNSNPYTNLVRYATEKEVNLVVVDGAPLYGNVNYLEQAGIEKNRYEIFSNEISIDNKASADQVAERLPKPDIANLKEPSDDEDDQTEDENTEATTPQKDDSFFGQLAANISSHSRDYPRKDTCKFEIPKAFVTPNTKPIEPAVDKFTRQGLDLDKVSDIQLLLAASSMSQSLNRLSPKGDPNYAMTYFPNLYTCSDSAEKNSHRYTRYVKSDGKDELAQNLVPETRAARRAIKGMPKAAENLATQYGLKFEVK